MTTTTKLTAALTGLLLSGAAAADCPTRPSWPTKAWPQRPVDAVAKAAALKALEDYAFTLEGADGERLGLRTDGLVLVKGGALIYERYGRGYGPENKHLAWSVAKSVSSALTGVAVKRGALDLEDSICAHLPEYQGQDACRIKVKHPLTFSSGLRWQEDYEDKPYQTSSVIAMLFGVGHRDQLAHVLGHQVLHEPGTQWNYSTGDAELLAAVVKRALEKTDGRDAFWTLLFDKLGMKVAFEEDLKGTPLGGSMVYATPRDYAKFGWLYLNDGCWNGERILPEGWVKASVTPSAAFAASAPERSRTPSGYGWWLNKPTPAQDKPKPWANSPDDAYAADGHWGQLIIVVPSEDLVIVRTGDDRKKDMDQDTLITLSLEVAR